MSWTARTRSPAPPTTPAQDTWTTGFLGRQVTGPQIGTNRGAPPPPQPQGGGIRIGTGRAPAPPLPPVVGPPPPPPPDDQPDGLPPLLDAGPPPPPPDDQADGLPPLLDAGPPPPEAPVTPPGSTEFHDRYDPLRARKQAALDFATGSGLEKTAHDTLTVADAAIKAETDKPDFLAAAGLIDGLVAAMDGLDAAIKQGIESEIRILDSWPESKTEATQLSGKLTALGTDLVGASGRPALVREIAEATTGWRLVRAHNIAMTAMQPTLTAVDKVPGKDVPTHAFKDEWLAYSAAKAKAPSPATVRAGAAGLAAARDELTVAAGALADKYRASGSAPTTWKNEEFQALLVQSAPTRTRADYLRPNTKDQIRLKAEFVAINITSMATLRQKIAKAEELNAVREQPPCTDEKKYHRAYLSIEKWVALAVTKAAGGADPGAAEKNALNAYYATFAALRDGAAADRYTQCLAKIAELKRLADAVMKPETDAAMGKIATLKSETSKTKQSRGAVEALAAMDGAMLANLSPGAKHDLLELVRADGVYKGPANDSRDRRRLAQRLLYGAMSLDDAFIKDEQIKRKAVIAELMKDKAELKKARDDWPLLPDDKKLEIFTKMMTVHCQKMGFPAPTGVPPIELTEKGAGLSGEYTTSTDKISINKNGQNFKDFELAMNTIFHENSHNYQMKMYDKLKAGETIPDPPLTQVQMFADNEEDYVPSSEDPDTYRKQPQENHSFYAGPKSARMLVKALASP